MADAASFEMGYEIHAFGVPINPYTGNIDVARVPVAGVLRGIDEPGKQGARIFDEVLRDVLIPPLVARWPRRTGYSGDNFDFNAGRLENPAPYARAVEARTGAIEITFDLEGHAVAGALDAEIQRIIDRGGPRGVARLGQLI